MADRYEHPYVPGSDGLCVRCHKTKARGDHS